MRSTRHAMIVGKLYVATRPRKLAAHVVAATGLGLGVALMLRLPIVPAAGGALVTVTLLRLAIIVAASRPPAALRRVLDGTAVLTEEGITIEATSGTTTTLPWRDVLDVSERAASFAFAWRLEDGRAWTAVLSKEGLDRHNAEGVRRTRELLRAAGKLT